MRAFGSYPGADSTFGVYHHAADAPQQVVSEVALLPEPVFKLLFKHVRANSDLFPALFRLRDEYRDHHFSPLEARDLAGELTALSQQPELSEIDAELQEIASFCQEAHDNGLGVTFSGN